MFISEYKDVTRYFNNLDEVKISICYIENLGYILIYNNEYNTYCYSIESDIVPTTLEINWDYDNPVIKTISDKIEWIFKEYIIEQLMETKGTLKK